MAQFKFSYLNGLDETITGDVIKIGDDFITVEQGGEIVAYRPRTDVKAADKVLNA